MKHELFISLRKRMCKVQPNILNWYLPINITETINVRFRILWQVFCRLRVFQIFRISSSRVYYKQAEILSFLKYQRTRLLNYQSLFCHWTTEVDQRFKTFKTVFHKFTDDKRQLELLILAVSCKRDAECLCQKLIAQSVLSNSVMQRQSVKHGTSLRVNTRSFTCPYFYAGNSGIICSFNKM